VLPFSISLTWYHRARVSLSFQHHQLPTSHPRLCSIRSPPCGTSATRLPSDIPSSSSSRRACHVELLFQYNAHRAPGAARHPSREKSSTSLRMAHAPHLSSRCPHQDPAPPVWIHPSCAGPALLLLRHICLCRPWPPYAVPCDSRRS
jgi:hypothetical protein